MATIKYNGVNSLTYFLSKVKAWASGKINGLIYDVSALHPTSGVSGGSTYASLSAALAVIPQDKRKGGMTVKFVLNSDNKYVQYRLKATSWSTTESDWVNVESEISQLGQIVGDINKLPLTSGVMIYTASGKWGTANAVCLVYQLYGEGKVKYTSRPGVSNTVKILSSNVIEVGQSANVVTDVSTSGTDYDATEENRYLYVLLSYNNENRTPLSVVINGYDIIKNIRENVYDIENKLKSLQEISYAVNKSFLPFGGKISIIGDSISAYSGTLPPSYQAYYPTGDVTSLYDMWWELILLLTGSSLDVNASYSGSRATKNGSVPDFYDRANILGTPDYIFVALGTNDSSNHVSLGDYDYNSAIADLSETEFIPAYTKGLKALMQNYPSAKIILYIFRMTDGYAAAIKNIGQHYNLPVIDVRAYYAGNNHPDKAGMRIVTQKILSYYLKADIEDGEITTGKLADTAVTGAKVANAAIDDTKLANAAAVWAKRTKAGSFALLLCTLNNAPIEFDTVNKTLTIKAYTRLVCGKIKTAVNPWTTDLVVSIADLPKGYLALDTTKSYITSESLILAPAASTSDLDTITNNEGYVLICSWSEYGAVVNAASSYLIDGNLYGIDTKPKFPLVSPTFDLIQLPSSNDGMSWWSDFIYIKINNVDEMWFFSDTKCHRINMADWSYIGSFTHNLGHCNTMQYDANYDILLMSNLPGTETYPSALYIFYNVSAWATESTIDFDSISRTVVDISDLGLGGNNAAFFGENSIGRRNIVYAMSAYGGSPKLYKLVLGMGANQLDYGTYDSDYSGNLQYNGTYNILSGPIMYTQPPSFNGDSNKEVIQGGDYANGRIITTNGHDQILGFYYEFINGEIQRTIIENVPRKADGSIDYSVAEGLCVIDGFVYQGVIKLNKKYSDGDYTVEGFNLAKYPLPY